MPPVPQRCARRPLAGGLVVPWVSLIHNGHAAFGSLDAERARAAFLHCLCQICGQSLNERCFVIVRPADVAQGHCPEPALHPECLPYTAAHCPMLNGTATRYRQRPVLASHAAGRPCTDPACPCPSLAPDHGDAARNGQPADRYEAWMIHTHTYRLVFPPGQIDAPSGISLDVPVLRTRVLRTAPLTAEQERLMALVHDLLDGTP
ncbi:MULTISPECIES: cell envelope biogenesis protein OmpA [unclassified Streptomyces]|uniref:Cell envelope biogenesis protein OmpA n=1 Tax=Streptomyces sp. NBC_00060 TaxID=2975636 RepID=A0AAU2HDG8_9ACTN